MEHWKSSEGAIELDYAAWPLLWGKVLRAPTDDEFASLLEQLTRVLRRAEAYVMVTESRITEALSITQLRAEASWHKRHAHTLARYCVGVAMVVPENAGPSRRFAASTVKSMGGKQATPINVFASTDEARAWAESCLSVIKTRAK